MGRRRESTTAGADGTASGTGSSPSPRFEADRHPAPVVQASLALFTLFLLTEYKRGNPSLQNSLGFGKVVRMKNKGFRRTILVSGAIFAVSFIALILVSYIWDKLGNDNNLIGTLESISTAVTAAAVFGAAYIAYQELSEIADTRHMDIADRLFGELNSPENIEARRRIFQNLNPDPEEGMKRLKKEDLAAMKKVLNSLDHVAFLTRPGWIPDDLIMPWMHPMIAKSWEKLEPYVLYEREHRDEPYYYEHAGELAARCNTWRVKNLTKAERTNKWVDKAL